MTRILVGWGVKLYSLTHSLMHENIPAKDRHPNHPLYIK